MENALIHPHLFVARLCTKQNYSPPESLSNLGLILLIFPQAN